ncbi:MAG: response regulator [Coraliomargarita sp. TMED73]|nr:MAG: response regulator [Coraliomargarita sp. TMED73]
MSQQKKPRILVVDDQPINVKLLQRKLERHDLDVLIATNGLDCIESVRKNHPDLILLDVMMPEMDGVETCRRLKADPGTATIPILFVTARTSKENKLEGLQAGAVDYITKPIDLEETLARIRTHLRLQAMYRENLQLQKRLGDARKTAAVGAITQGIAHNLNNLLGVVIGYLDLIKTNGECSEFIARNLTRTDNALNRMTHIIQQLTSIAKNEQHERSIQQIEALLQSSLERFRGEHPVTAEIPLQTDLPERATMRANPEIFESILGKLLENAWESYREDSPEKEHPIQIKADLIEKRGIPLLRICIIDQGSGLHPSVAENLFEPFATTKTNAGSGMGLTISRHTLRNLGGDIQLAPNPDHGMTATLTHPID